MSKQSRPWNRRQRRAIKRNATKRFWRAGRPRNWSGGRGIAETMALDLAWRGPVNPHLFDAPHWPTSTRRRWAQLTRVAMKRETPHPRPWEGPRLGLNFEGIFNRGGIGQTLDWSVPTAEEMLSAFQVPAERLFFGMPPHPKRNGR